jgi:hypothetical protein
MLESPTKEVNLLDMSEQVSVLLGNLTLEEIQRCEYDNDKRLDGDQIDQGQFGDLSVAEGFYFIKPELEQLRDQRTYSDWAGRTRHEIKEIKSH